ncbi:MAG: C40 family peptidase [Candidatus Kapabacteria bacterium]|nr:C40 family peptidase [Candidatus Kapabacteria bacterium]MDW8012536.1 C40 family peptidase [Bacteroidota bacterium]
MRPHVARRSLAWLCIVGWGWVGGILSGCHSTARFAHLEAKPSQSEASEREPRLFEERLWREIERWLGIPYCRSGIGTECVDCSGFVQQVYKALGVSLPRTSAEQSKVGQIVSGEPLPGDLVIAAHNLQVRHIGIYLGNGRVVHASRSRGVVIDPLSVFSSIAPDISFRRVIATR